MPFSSAATVSLGRVFKYELGMCELGVREPGACELGELGVCELGACELGVCELGFELGVCELGFELGGWLADRAAGRGGALEMVRANESTVALSGPGSNAAISLVARSSSTAAISVVVTSVRAATSSAGMATVCIKWSSSLSESGALITVGCSDPPSGIEGARNKAVGSFSSSYPLMRPSHR